MDRFPKIIASLFFLSLAIPVHAAAVLTARIVYPFAGTQALINIQIQDDKLRMNLNSQNYDTAYVFRRDQNLLWIVDYRTKTYFEFTASDMSNLVQSVDSKIITLETRAPLSYLEKAQLRQLKQLQFNLKEANGSEELDYRLIDSKKPLGSWDCLLYEGLRGTEKTVQLWTLDLVTLGISADEAQTFAALQPFSFHLSGQLAGIANLLKQSPKFKGLVAKREELVKDKVRRRIEVAAVKPGDFESSVFDLPEGFTKTEWQLH